MQQQHRIVDRAIRAPVRRAQRLIVQPQLVHVLAIGERHVVQYHIPSLLAGPTGLGVPNTRQGQGEGEPGS